jgi:hypothetical protein
MKQESRLLSGSPKSIWRTDLPKNSTTEKLEGFCQQAKTDAEKRAKGRCYYRDRYTSNAAKASLKRLSDSLEVPASFCPGCSSEVDAGDGICPVCFDAIPVTDSRGEE